MCPGMAEGRGGRPGIYAGLTAGDGSPGSPCRAADASAWREGTWRCHEGAWSGAASSVNELGLLPPLQLWVGP